MMLENRQFIGFEDIIGIQFECLKCHAKQTLPITNVRRMATQCINCDAKWFTGQMETGDATINFHLSSIAGIQSRVKLLRDLEHLQITLEVVSQEPEIEDK